MSRSRRAHGGSALRARVPVTAPRPASAAGPGPAPTGIATKVALALALAVAVVLGARVGPWLLLLVVAGATGIGAVELGTDFGEQRLATSPLLYLAGVAAFPVAAYFWKEPGLTAAAAAVIIIAALRFVLARPERGAVLSIAAFVLAALYLGFGASYVVLLDRRAHGAALVDGLVLIAVLFHAGRFLADRLSKRTLAPHLPGAPTLLGALGGTAGCLLGAVGLLKLAGYRIAAVPMLQIGLSAGAAFTLGGIAWALIRPDRAPVERSHIPGQMLAVVAGAVLAAPVLYYAVRLAFR
jgi:hypothetical protein